MHQCPHCRSTERQVKSGFNRTGSQRLQCQSCRHQYTTDPNPLGYDDKIRETALKLDLGGNSLRPIGRLLGVNHQSVANWVNSAHARLPPEPAGPKTPEAGGTLKMGELFTFIEGKKSPPISSPSSSARRGASSRMRWTPEVMQSVIDAAPSAERYFSDAFNIYRELCWWGEHHSMYDKSEAYLIEGDNAEFQHYLVRPARRSRCFSTLHQRAEASGRIVRLVLERAADAQAATAVLPGSPHRRCVVSDLVTPCYLK